MRKCAISDDVVCYISNAPVYYVGPTYIAVYKNISYGGQSGKKK